MPLALHFSNILCLITYPVYLFVLLYKVSFPKVCAGHLLPLSSSSKASTPSEKGKGFPKGTTVSELPRILFDLISYNSVLMTLEVGLGNVEKLGCLTRWQLSLIETVEKLKADMMEPLKKLKKIGEDDPTRIVHSFKVGLALTLVSFFYYVKALYSGFGVSAMWAVLTVVVVMEYTVGGTFSKGLNRAFGTLLAGTLGVAAHYLAILFGEKGEPIILGLFVFLLATTATFVRFIPKVKARYDYGVLIFILTFSLVALSSYRVDELIKLAHRRLFTIAIGGTTCICTSVFVFPKWAGEDLHKLAALNLEKLASYLEGLAVVYFAEEGTGNATVENTSFLQGYKSVLNSKATEESLANFARWEPGHGKFGFRHPWKQYLKIGAFTRQCAYCIEALNSHIITKSENQVSLNIPRNIREACQEMSSESARTLRELASAIRTMRISSTDRYTLASSAAITKLESVLLDKDIINEILYAASIASLLTDIVSCTKNIAKSVEELGHLAKFKCGKTHHKAAVEPISDEEGSQVIVEVGR